VFTNILSISLRPEIVALIASFTALVVTNLEWVNKGRWENGKPAYAACNQVNGGIELQN
jgi:hypothetical protein